MQAFFNNPDLKAKLLIEIGKHEAADALVKGSYGNGDTLPVGSFKGCAIGCALHSLNLLNGEYCPTPESVRDHARFPRQLGIPIELAYHIDTIFENLPDVESQTWPRRVLEAIQPGVALSSVIPALLQWMILDPTDGFIASAQPAFHETYRQLAVLVDQDWRLSGSVSSDQWDAIDRALASDDIWTWARARAGTGAWARARAWAGTGAWVRARAGTGAWARARGWAPAYSRLSEKTLELIRECR